MPSLTRPPRQVAIIGAGIAGYILALTLHQQDISSIIYELRGRDAPGHVGGAIMTSPNALRILDKLGLYEDLQHKGHNFEKLHFYTEDHKLLDTYYFGEEKFYGYKGLRIHRAVLLETLRDATEARDIPIIYNKSFASIISDSADTGVSFSFKDGSTATADMLIGADGIHSKVRHSLFPNTDPTFVGFIGVTSAVPLNKLRLPTPEYALPATILTKRGNFVIAPQSADGSEVFIGRQFRAADRDRKGWDELVADKQRLLSMMQEDMDVFPDVARSALESVSLEKLNIWPFYRVPQLSSWISESHRVVLIGDASHALPPTTGGGANQAFEDSYTLGLLLARVTEDWCLDKVLPLWFDYRDERVDGLRVLTRQMDNKRLPIQEQAKLAEGEVWMGTGAEQMRWLYGPEVGEQCFEYVRKGMGERKV